MAFGGGFFGSGESRTESLTQASETGQQVEQGQAFSVSNIETGKKSTVNIDATTTDHGAVAASLAVADRSVETAAGVVDDAIQASGIAAQLAINSSDDARRDALEFGAGALVEVSEAFNDSRTFVLESQESAFDFVGDSAERVLDASESARVDALQFGAGALDLVRENATSSIDAIGEFSGAAIDRFVSASKSESAQLTDNVLGFAKVAVIAIAATIALRAFK